MKKYSKINKKQIIFTFLLTFNQLLLSGYTFSNKKIDSNVFENNTSIEEITINNAISVIANSGFKNCTKASNKKNNIDNANIIPHTH